MYTPHITSVADTSILLLIFSSQLNRELELGATPYFCRPPATSLWISLISSLSLALRTKSLLLGINMALLFLNN